MPPIAHIALAVVLFSGSAVLPVRAVGQGRVLPGEFVSSTAPALLVKWHSQDTAVGRLATLVVARENHVNPDQVLSLEAALFNLSNHRQLLLVQGSGYSGASATGIGIFADRHGGVLKEVGTIGSSHSDHVSVVLHPQGADLPILLVGIYAPTPFDARLSMANQVYAPVTHTLVFDKRSGQYRDLDGR